ncbi:hypothetical protein MNBD_NITROSPINAE02-1786 [hydrothermal vent metagenome]|uniref:Glycosyltransferase RgtA/B/C/D-like domain-containing protein n=1 Tax=hydrothermal vent metagenome TaxID=652676 RepID=A0A3B1CG82_9ZZZZ
MENSDRNKISRSAIFSGLVSFHFLISVIMSLIARSTYLSGYHNGKGLWFFAMDSIEYNRQAIQIAESLGNGMFYDWWWGTPFIHVNFISVFYFLIAPDPLSFAVVNAAIWAASVICVFHIARVATLCSEKYALFIAAVYGLWPTGFLLTTQLLKDPFFNLGCLMVLLGWISLLSGSARTRFVAIILAGYSLCIVIRPEPWPIFILVSIIAVLIIAVRARQAFLYALLAFILMTGFTATKNFVANAEISRNPLDAKRETDQAAKHQINAESEKDKIEEIKREAKAIIKDGYDEQLDKTLHTWLTDKRYAARVWTIWERERIVRNLAKIHGAALKDFLKKEMEPWEKTGWLPSSLEMAIYKVSRSRDSLLTYYAKASSFTLDSGVQFRNVYDVVKYIPRGIEIGFLAPFPNHWLTKSHTSGGASRLLAGMEMIIWYILYAGFIFYCARSTIDCGIKLWIIIICFAFVMSLGIFIPNIGTLYRMRFIYLAPVLVTGLEGLRMLISGFSFQKRLPANPL